MVLHLKVANSCPYVACLFAVGVGEYADTVDACISPGADR